MRVEKYSPLTFSHTCRRARLSRRKLSEVCPRGPEPLLRKVVHFSITENADAVVLQQSTPPQIRQLIRYHY